MTIALLMFILLWLACLTWYVVRLALAPVPVPDVEAAIKQIAVAKVRDLARTSPGRELLRQRLAARREGGQ